MQCEVPVPVISTGFRGRLKGRLQHILLRYARIGDWDHPRVALGMDAYGSARLINPCDLATQVRRAKDDHPERLRVDRPVRQRPLDGPPQHQADVEDAGGNGQGGERDEKRSPARHSVN